MELDPERVYKAIDGLGEKIDALGSQVAQVLVHQAKQNGRVNRNVECIAANTSRLDEHDKRLSDHGDRIVRLERGEEVEAEWQREFREDTKQEHDWSRDKILELFVKIAPWGLLIPLVVDRLF